ncbi:MAG: protein translocase subunit SecF, partial [Victivallaceae bacterium]
IADALTSGSFPFKINVDAVYDTAPTLGADNVQNGIRAGIIAMVLLATFMITYYRWAGVIAVTALTINLVLILGAMAAFGATLTMPGIAGIILTLGMAVDANVLVFERMREETENGKSAVNVVDLGFQKAYSSVIDGNLTTLVVAIILMYFGTGAIKGFAVSLSIGIVFSLFTALFMSHVIFDWIIHFRSNVKFSMLKFFSKPNFDFMKQSKVAIPISLALIVLSIGTIIYKGESMMSVEFTGGTLLSCRYNQNVPISDLEKSLTQAGYNARVTYKSNPAARVDNKKVEILIRQGSDEAARTSGLELQQGVTSLLNQQYPQLQVSDSQVTSVGGMVGAEMTKNAFLSILLSFLGMIVYVSLRYEFNYAAAGILALLHDVIIALGISVLLGREMSLVVVAALLTIVGYSINDTIVIFDRIREERHLFPEKDFTEIVNESLNRTLSRTILTSLSTLIVVVVMFFFGGIA